MIFAVIDDGLVSNIVEAEDISLASLFFQDSDIIEVTPDTNNAYVGLSFNKTKQRFEQPKIFDSWVLDNDTLLWKPPKEYPTDGTVYFWDESIKDWAVSPIQE